MTTQPEALRLAQALNNRQECEDDAADELRRLHAAEADFYMAYRMQCDEQTKALHAENEALHKANEALRKANEAFAKRQEWWNERMLALERQLEALKQRLAMCRDMRIAQQNLIGVLNARGKT